MEIDIRKPLRKFAPHFLEAKTGGMNEADTVQRLCRFFEDVLGYDGMQDISREAQMKNKFIDICLKVDGRIRLLVEAKAAGSPLKDRHIEQAEMYGSQNNYRWVVLTNGVDWHLYHLTFEEGIESTRAFTVSLDGDEAIESAASKLALLHKTSIRKGELDQFWEKAAALGPASLGKALFNEEVLMVLRREIRRDTGLLIDTEDLAKRLSEMLSPEIREQVGPPKVRRKRKNARKVPAKTDSAKLVPNEDAEVL